MKTLGWLIVIVVVLVGGIAYYNYRTQNRSLTNGDVFMQNQRVIAPDAAAQTQTATTGNGTTADASTAPASQNGAVPVRDTISRNPPNELKFSGTGPYQLYRQGDLTWRVNTENGQTCIIFATDEQWRRARVYQHGCGNS